MEITRILRVWSGVVLLLTLTAIRAGAQADPLDSLTLASFDTGSLLHAVPPAALHPAFHLLAITARPASPLALQYGQGAYPGMPRYAEILCVVRNMSGGDVTVDGQDDFRLLSFDVKGKGVRVLQPSSFFMLCNSRLTLPPGGSFTQTVPVLLDDTVKDGEKVTFRIRFGSKEHELRSSYDGFVLGGVSNPVTLVRRGDIADAVSISP